MEMTAGLATLAICFRFGVGSYAIEWFNRGYLYLLKGKGKTIEELGGIFASGDPPKNERIIAAEALEKFGADAADAIPYLATSFEIKHLEIQRAGIKALKKIGRPAISHLVVLSANKDSLATKSIRKTLREIDPKWHESDEAKSAVPDLIELLADGNVRVRYTAEETLKTIDPNWVQSKTAMDAISYFLDALVDPDYNVRTAGAEALGTIGADSRIAVFRLVKALVDTNGHVRKAAAEALDRIHPGWQHSKEAGNAIPHLIQAMRHKDKEVRTSVPEALSRIGEPAVPALISQLKETDKEIGRLSIEALSKITPPPVSPLREVLEGKNETARVRAAMTLFRIGLPAMGDLIKALGNKDPDIRRLAAQTIYKMGIRTIPSLIDSLAAGEPPINPGIMAVLGKFGPASARAVPYLSKALADERLMKYAEKALEKIDPKGELRRI
jgi:HEAT repeat protein